MIDPAFAMLALGAAGGAVVPAATGFGFAIVAAPVFLAVLNSHAALQILVVIHLVQSVMMLREVWPHVPVRLLRALIIGAAVGSPIGLAAFVSLDVRSLKLAVGCLILLFTALLVAREAGLLGRPLPAGKAGVVPDTAGTPRPRTYIAGGVSGAMTSLLVMPGPPLMLYFADAPLPHLRARALAVVFFAFCYLFVTALNTFVTGMGEGVWPLALGLALPVYLGTLAGQQIARRVTQGAFRAAVFALLVLSGIGAIVSAL